MPSDKDVCRICVREVTNEAAEDIDLSKLRNLIKTNVLPKWNPVDFTNHLICETCLTNCRTVQQLHRYVRSANATMWNFMKNPQKFKKFDKFDLRLTPRFKNVPLDLEICRCCSESTSKLQIAVSLHNSDFSVLPGIHVENMLKTMGLNLRNLSETLNPVMCCKCWQRVQVSFAFRNRLNLVDKKVQHYRTLHQTTYETRNNLNDILVMWNNLAPEKHDSEDEILVVENSPIPHVILDVINQTKLKCYLDKYNKSVSKKNTLVRNDEEQEMPLLTAEVDAEEIKQTNNPIRRSLRHKTSNDLSQKKHPVVEKLRVSPRRTRSSTRNQSSTLDYDFNDLLVVMKEEIIRPQRQKQKKAQAKQQTAPTLVAESVQDYLSDAKDGNVEYTFDRFDFNEGIVSDTDDEFIESTGPLNNSDDRCPIISPEPQEIEILNLDDYDDSPPELELQEPCEPVNFVVSQPFSLEEKQSVLKLQKNNCQQQQQDGILKKVGLSVRTDLLQPKKPLEPSKTVEPLLINLNTMEVSNKPPPPVAAKNLKIHSNEVILPNYKLRNSEVNQQKNGLKPSFVEPPPLTPLDHEFKSGDRIMMKFDNRPINSLKRVGGSEDGAGLAKRAKLSDNSEVNGSKTSKIPESIGSRPAAGNSRVSLLAEKSSAGTQLVRKSEIGNRGRTPLAQKYQPSGSGSNIDKKSTNTRMTFSTQKTLQKITPLPAITNSKKVAPASLNMPKLTTYHSQKPATELVQKNSDVIVPLTMNNLPQNLKNLTNNSNNNKNFPIIQKIMFLENGNMVLVDQPVKLAESQTSSSNNKSPMLLQKVNQPIKKLPPKIQTNPAPKSYIRKVIPNASTSKLKIPEGKLVDVGLKKSSPVPRLIPRPSTSAPVKVQRQKIVMSDFILISSDDEEEAPNLPLIIAN